MLRHTSTVELSSMKSEAVRLADATSGPFRVASLAIDAESDPMTGRVRWDPWRSIWNASMLAVTVGVAPFCWTWGSVSVFALLLAITMCTGHSVGFHRRLIHRSFQCRRWVERLLVWSGTLVGMQGPFWVIHSHDLRDWAQRQSDCHPYLRHGRGLLVDAFWSLHCRLELARPPAFDPGPGIADDPFYQFLQRYWALQQLPIAVLLYAIGGLPWVVWGVGVRVCVGVSMHWFVGYLCHSRGPQDWLVDDGAVQAHNVAWAAIPSMGESWHNNHHAFPASARHGLYPGQIDIGFRFVQWLERLGLAWSVQVPQNLPERPGITRLTQDAGPIRQFAP